jgi:hypothetical protein
VQKDFDNQTILVVNQLFKDLFSVNPAWKVSIGNDEDISNCKRQWISAFKENNITSIELLRKGMVKMRARSSPFFVSPGEFIAMCALEAKDIGAPPLDDAYMEAIRNAYPDGTEKKWSHPAVKYAAHKSDMFFLRNRSAHESKPRFKENYELACKEHAEGKTLNQIEDQSKDSVANRQKYQEYYGGCMQSRSYSKNPESIEILSYDDWLKVGFK